MPYGLNCNLMLNNISVNLYIHIFQLCKLCADLTFSFEKQFWTETEIVTLQIKLTNNLTILISILKHCKEFIAKNN